MNREERRNLMKQGASKETLDKLEQYNKPCTILEVVKLSRAVSEDVVNEAMDEYRRSSASTIISLLLQVEILRDTIIKAGLITTEEFQSIYEQKAKEFEEKEREMLAAMRKAELEQLQDMETAIDSEIKEGTVDMKPQVNTVEVAVSKRESITKEGN